MGDISSKSCIDAIKGSNLMQSQSQGSSKGNIVVMNPEIHLHSNNNGVDTSSSVNNEMRIKKLEEELKIKEIEIALEREKRQLEERERHADNIKANKLLYEKQNMIQAQNDLLGWHADNINEQRACLGEVYEYGQSEKRIRMEHGTADGVQQKKKKRKKKKGRRPHPTNRSADYANANENAHNYRGERHRSSKAEYIFKSDPMELWEWNGTKWVMIKSNAATQNTTSVDGLSCSKGVREPYTQNSDAQTGGHLTSVAHERKTEDELHKNILSASKMCDDGPTNRQFVANVPMTTKMHEKPIEVASSTVCCLDETVDHTKYMDLSHRRVASEITFPTDISISFDQREISKYFTHDETLFPMPKRTRQP